jgi:hypothetical protein
MAVSPVRFRDEAPLYGIGGTIRVAEAALRPQQGQEDLRPVHPSPGAQGAGLVPRVRRAPAAADREDGAERPEASQGNLLAAPGGRDLHGV